MEENEIVDLLFWKEVRGVDSFGFCCKVIIILGNEKRVMWSIVFVM